MKTNQGITLIALVITIIVLLILAGFTILMLTGENGILGKSQKASEETNKQTATEKINLKITNIQIATYTEKQQMPNLQDLANGLCNDEENEIEYVITKDKPVASKLPFVDTNGYDSIFTKLTEYPYEFEIDSNLHLASIDGVKVADTSNDKNYEQVMSEIGDLKNRLGTVETENADLKTRIGILESTTQNKRIKLLNQPVTIPLTQTSWEEGDYANIQLIDSIRSYQYLEIQFDCTDFSALSSVEKTIFIPTESLKIHNSNNHSNAQEHIFYLTTSFSTDSTFGVMGWFKNEKLLHIGARWNNHSQVQGLRIRNIYGIR